MNKSAKVVLARCYQLRMPRWRDHKIDHVYHSEAAGPSVALPIRPAVLIIDSTFANRKWDEAPPGRDQRRCRPIWLQALRERLESRSACPGR